MENIYSAPQADLSNISANNEPGQVKFFSLNGRIGRLRYLTYLSCSWLAMTAVSKLVLYFLGVYYLRVLMIDLHDPHQKLTFSIISAVIALVCFIPLVAVALIMAKRRFNDLNQSGWQTLWNLVPLVNLFLFFFLVFVSGTPDRNEYGPQPTKNSLWIFIGGGLLPILTVVAIVVGIVISRH